MGILIRAHPRASHTAVLDTHVHQYHRDVQNRKIERIMSKRGCRLQLEYLLAV